MTSPLMKFTLQDRDTLHELDQPLKELAYVSNHWGPLLFDLSFCVGLTYEKYNNWYYNCCYKLTNSLRNIYPIPFLFIF